MGFLSHSVWKSGHVVSAPSLHRESTNSLINTCTSISHISFRNKLTNLVDYPIRWDSGSVIIICDCIHTWHQWVFCKNITNRCDNSCIYSIVWNYIFYYILEASTWEIMWQLMVQKVTANTCMTFLQCVTTEEEWAQGIVSIILFYIIYFRRNSM